MASFPPRAPRGLWGSMGALAKTKGPLLVVLLGAVSALALFGASAMDYGDPRVEARANARVAVEARAETLRVRWNVMRSANEAPAGVTRVLVSEAGPESAWRGGFAPQEAGDRPRDPVFEVLLDSALAALMRGDARAGLSALVDALGEAPSDCQRREEALFAAARAAAALLETDEVERYRALLMESKHDAVVSGTSVKLLAHWVAPLDPAGAFALLVSDAPLLPACRDRAIVESARLTVRLDPWWRALYQPMAATRPELDWERAFRIEEREALAAHRLVVAEGVQPDTRWTIVDIDGALVAVREQFGATSIGSVDRATFEAAWNIEPGPSDPIVSSLVAPGEDHRGAAPFAGSPYALLVQHVDPEGSARVQMRRIRWLRGGLSTLGALVLLAAIGSARAMSRSRRLAELRSTFVASVSHDLRTPTQAILLMSEMLEGGLVPDDEKRTEYHGQIRREAQRLRRLVEDLLDGGRIERGGGARIVRSDVAIGPLLDELERAMEERAKDTGASFSMTRTGLPEVVYVDGDGVHRVLWNLCENALLHGHAPEEPAVITVEVGWEMEVLTCVIADRGPGVPERHRETVFGAFERLSDRAQKADGIASDTGTGLGLAIVRAIARAHGGDARLESHGDHGARFVVTFVTAELDGELE